MREHGERFDHNLHALRIVEHFEQKYVSFPGLNLTFEVREGIIKHSCDYDPAKYPELREYRLSERPALEAQLIDVADEIAYNCADLDDGYESKLLTLRQMRDALPLFERFYRPLEKEHAAALEKLRFNETLKRLLDALVTDLIESTRARLRETIVDSAEAVRRQPERLAGLGSPMAGENRRLKTFLFQKLYSHPKLRAERQAIVQSVEGLFHHFMDHPRSLPPTHAAKAPQEPLHRVVCDYLAGMTDHYLAEQYQKHVRP